MHKITRIAAGTAFAGSLLFTGGLAPASAVGPIQANNLVNVNISGNTVTVPVNVAASLAVTACDVLDVTVNQVAVLSRAIAVDRSGQQQTICRTESGDVTITNDIVNR